MPPEPHSWIDSPCRYSPPWNRLSPEMIRLDIPAQVMLAVGLGRVEGVRPAPVAFLAALPVAARQLPDGRLHGNADFTGGMQPQQGVLGVGIIAGPAALRLGVAPRAGPGLRVTGLDLGLLEPGDVGSDPQLVLGRVGRRVDHRLQANRIGAVQVVGAEPCAGIRGPS